MPPGTGNPRRIPAGLLLACAPGWNGRRFSFYPGLRTPQLPTAHARAETGQRALARVLRLRPKPNLQQRLPLETHAPSHRTQSPVASITTAGTCQQRSQSASASTSRRVVPNVLVSAARQDGS
jgi:hypothetical protein